MKNEERLFYREEGLRLFDSVEVEMHYNLEMEENSYSLRKPVSFLFSSVLSQRALLLMESEF
jgi:hypothetical protein